MYVHIYHLNTYEYLVFMLVTLKLSIVPIRTLSYVPAEVVISTKEIHDQLTLMLYLTFPNHRKFLPFSYPTYKYHEHHSGGANIRQRLS